MKITAVLLYLLFAHSVCSEQGVESYEYLFFTPTNKKLIENDKFPLIVFLHGAGERGDELSKVRVHGPPKIVEQDASFPFMVFSPQCPADRWWEAEKLDKLLDEIVSNHQVDERRIYLTGLSMGGYATWDWVTLRPNRFAAIAPICGGDEEDARNASIHKQVPTWVFHGEEDMVVPFENSVLIVEELKQKGSPVIFTSYPETGHNSWTETYNNPLLYDWFVSHSIN
jgi:predicted peptidase